ncbi:YdgH/BhsA/McbA-like domain containing protein [Hafnia alvei]|uniref:YdgH/BhsA/McbA-like domain containing protein n=1 Tax=Hafnia alvei TaxID=569 RepID=UPI004043BF76
MKKYIFLLSLVLFSSYSLSAVEVSKSQTTTLHKVGHVSIHGDTTILSPEDARNALNAKVDKIGSRYYYIVALGTAGDSSVYNVDAIIYN